MREEDKKELEQAFKEKLYEKFYKTKNPKGLESLNTILCETIDELDIDVDKILAEDEKYLIELSMTLDSILLEKVSNAENLAKIMKEEANISKKT